MILYKQAAGGCQIVHYCGFKQIYYYVAIKRRSISRKMHFQVNNVFQEGKKRCEPQLQPNRKWCENEGCDTVDADIYLPFYWSRSKVLFYVSLFPFNFFSRFKGKYFCEQDMKSKFSGLFSTWVLSNFISGHVKIHEIQ